MKSDTSNMYDSSSLLTNNDDDDSNTASSTVQQLWQQQQQQQQQPQHRESSQQLQPQQKFGRTEQTRLFGDFLGSSTSSSLSSATAAGAASEDSAVAATAAAAPPVDDSDEAENDAIEAVRRQVVMDGSLGHAGVEDFMAKEMLSLSLNEREKAYEDIHGVSSEVDETPEFVAQKLREMALALHELEYQYPEPDEESRLTVSQLQALMESIPRPTHHNPRSMNLRAYRLAKKQNPAYVTSSKLRLMFLRCELFNVRPAAVRMIKFFDAKFHFFGAQTLTRPVLYSDLTADAKKTLEMGAFQLLEQRDSVGRAVLFDVFPILPSGPLPLSGLCGAITYVILAAAEDELTQRKGLVLVQYFIGQLTLMGPNEFSQIHRQVIQEGSSLWHWLPLRLCAVHQCINDFLLRTMAKLLVLDMGQTRRMRTRSHHGSHSEVQYSLMSFGIPVDIFPLTYDGGVKVAQQAKWIARRKIKDRHIQQHGTFEGVELPGRDDILFGRGRKYQFHPGNNKMRVLVRDLYPQYSELSKVKKVEMAWSVTLDLKKNGRFLKQHPENGYWMPVPDDEAQKKVAVAFRKPQHQDDTPIRNSASPSSVQGASNDSSEDVLQPTKKICQSPDPETMLP